MAIRLGLGRFLAVSSLVSKCRQWGVRGSLFTAFAVIAGMGLVIAAGAGFVFNHLGATMMDLSGRDIPRLSASLQLASQSATLAAQGPGLLASPSDEALNERTKKVKEIQQLAMAKLGEIIELGADKQIATALRDTAKSIDEATQSLVSAARERLDTGALHDKQYEALRKAQLTFVGAAGPAMLDAQTRLNAILGAAEVSADDATEAARTVAQVSTISANGNLMAADMMAALSANNSDTLEAIEKEFKATRDRVKSNLEDLPNMPSMQAVRDAVQKLFAFGEGKTGVFKIRQKELDAIDYGQTILDETRKLNVGLGISVQQLVDGVQKETNASTFQARQEISLATTAMLALGALMLVGSALFVWLYVGRNILRRIRELQRVDAAALGRRSRHRDRPLPAERRDRRDDGNAAGVPRQHDRGPGACERAGQGPRRQGRARRAAWRRRSPSSRARCAPRSTISRSRPIRCSRPRRACRPPPTSPTRW